jgi:hypothetical protein
MRLTHYTRTIEAVANILTHGFAWVPNKRKLIQKFVPHHNFSGREPQQLFGMISFTEAVEEKGVGRGIGHGYCARSIGLLNRRLGSPDTVVAGSRDSGRFRRCESASRACAWQEGMRLK